MTCPEILTLDARDVLSASLLFENDKTIDPLFGTNEEFYELIEKAHSLGLRIIVDIVPNHSSDQHELFQAALKAAPGSPERDMYVFRDGKGENGELPGPNARMTKINPIRNVTQEVLWPAIAIAKGQTISPPVCGLPSPAIRPALKYHGVALLSENARTLCANLRSGNPKKPSDNRLL